MSETLRYLYASGTDTVTIKAKTGFNHHVLDVWVDGPANNSYVDVIVGTRTVARIPVKYNDCLFFAPYSGSFKNISFLTWLRQFLGEDWIIEADESEDITFKFSAAPSAVHVLYKEDKEGIDKSRPLKSLSETVLLMPLITHSAAISASQNYSLDKCYVPTGFVEIKDGLVVPSGIELIFKAFAFASKANVGTKPTKLHFWIENFEYFTPTTHEGISVDPSANFLVFDIKTLDVFEVQDIVARPGQKLTLNFDAVYDGSNTLDAESLYFIPLIIKRPLT